MDWNVINVQPLKDYKLLITFHDKSRKIYDCKPYLSWAVFKDLNDVNLFNKVEAKHGTVYWNDNLDLCPETLYEKGVSL